MSTIYPTPEFAQPKPLLHVECCTKMVETAPKMLADEVTQWLRDQYVVLQLGQTITTFPGMHSPEDIDFIEISDATHISEKKSLVSVSDTDIVVDVFHLLSNEDDHTYPADSLGDHDPEKENFPQPKVTKLPSKDLHGVWKTLIFEDPIQFGLLRFIIRMISFSARQINHYTVGWNRLILLYGPPGTGKTSLCRALAQQLSIRLGGQYPCSKLVEIDANSLFSKYFSESSKLVSKVFKTIEAILDTEEGTFVCIFIDEVESLASARQYSSTNNEPRDALRAVNALLIALDRIRDRPNVVVLCTSNLIRAMDPAFLDRVDIKQYIPEPCARARYEIYRACYIELSKCGIIAPIHHVRKEDICNKNAAMQTVSGSQSPDTLGSEDDAYILDEKYLPEYDILYLRYWNDLDSLAWKLWTIVEKSANLSGRTLRRLPTLALAMYTKKDPCSIEEAFAALSIAVQKEKLLENCTSIESLH